MKTRKSGLASESRVLSRRQFVQHVGAGTLAMALGAHLNSASALGAPDLVRKKLPRTGETVPAIGMGSFMTFDVLAGAPRENLREVMSRFYEGGGRVIDTSPLYGNSEVNVGEIAGGLAISDKLFFTDKMWVTGEYLSDTSHAERSLDRSMRRLWRENLDVVQVHSLTNVEIMVPFLNAMKAEGRIRYVGVTHHDVRYFEPLAWWVENGPIDFVQVHYSIRTRDAESRILRAAQDRGIAVMLNMPLEKARLHKIVEGRSLPDFAAEIGVSTWSQFFLKWAISHPAVTCALPATTNPDHMQENLVAMNRLVMSGASESRSNRIRLQCICCSKERYRSTWIGGGGLHLHRLNEVRTCAESRQAP